MPETPVIGILETGRPDPAPQNGFGTYPSMIEALLGSSGAGFAFRTYSVLENVFPGLPSDCQGWIVTGSKHGVYEELPWMLRLEAFLRDIVRAEVPLVGICFGHQILAKAMGGRVEKSAKGWGIGIKPYDISEPRGWMAPFRGTVNMTTIHQDQVVELPPSAAVISGSGFCPFAMLAYGASAISFQAHPEFHPDFLRQEMAKPRFADAAFTDAKATLDNTLPDTALLAGWLANFLKGTALDVPQ